MGKELCFRINSRELFLEEILVEYDHIPVYFICVDNEQEYYVILCTDIDNENYIIVKSDIQKILDLLTRKITMRQIILKERTYWNIVAGEIMNEDVYQEMEISEIPLDVLPYEDSYFELLTNAHKELRRRLEDTVFSQMDDWEKVLGVIDTNELDIQIKIDYIYVDEYIEIDSIKKTSHISISYSSRIGEYMEEYAELLVRKKVFKQIDFRMKKELDENSILNAA